MRRAESTVPGQHAGSASLDCIAALVVVLGPDGCVVEWNKACGEALGFSRQEVRGRALWDVLSSSPAQTAELQCTLARLRDGESSIRLESHCRTRDGKYRAIVWEHQAQRDALGKLALVVATGFETTAQSRGQSWIPGDLYCLQRERESTREQLLAREHDALRSAEQECSRLQAILQSAPTGMLFIEVGSGHIVANSALRQLLLQPGQTEHGVGQCLDELRHPQGQPLAPDQRPWVRALRGAMVENEQLCVFHPAGKRTQVLVTAAPVRGAAGEIMGAVALFQDISARYQLEQLQREYVSLISHDLGSPLNAMSMGVQLLQEILEQRPGSAEAHVVKKISQSCQTMRSMIEELLEIGRLESGCLELRREPTDLPRLIEQVLDSGICELERERVRLVAEHAMPDVSVDPSRMGRVVLNLVANALKYSPADSPVEVEVTLREGRASIAVRDHGPGISPAEAMRLFEKHYRTDAASHTAGSGLGLYICRLIVDAHGGDICIDSTPGHGATFSVLLPLR